MRVDLMTSYSHEWMVIDLVRVDLIKACDSELLYSYILCRYPVSDHISVAYLSCTQAISETRPDSRMRVPASLVEWGAILAVLESGRGLRTCVWKCTSLSPLIAPVYHCCSKSKSGDQALLAPLLKRNVNYYSCIYTELALWNATDHWVLTCIQLTLESTIPKN